MRSNADGSHPGSGSRRGRWAAVMAGAVVLAACGGGDSSSDDADPPADDPPAADDGSDATSDGATETTEAPATTAPPPTTIPIPEFPDLVFDIAGPEEVVFDYSESLCGTEARPDLPTRAIRTPDGVWLSLAHETNHRMLGADFDSLTVSCEPTYQSAYDHDPANFAHHEWFGAVYTDDGVTLHGVIHNEFHGYESELADSRRALRDGEDPGDWQYFARSGDALTPMAPSETGFAAGGLCVVEFWGAHPDLGCEAVARWTSDRDGQLVIDVDAFKPGVGGDGVLVDVRIDGAVVWEAELTDATNSASTRLTQDVALGSTIDVGVAAGGDSSFDAVELRTVITPDGERCTVEDTFSCQYVTLTAIRSDDGGATFTPTADPPVLVAAPPGQYVHDAGLAATWQPSSILAHPDGGHVMFVHYDDRRDLSNTKSYSCLLRTDDLADPTAWRAWDGEAFSLPAVDAYRTDGDAPECARVAPAPISSLTWHPELELFVAVGSFALADGNGQYAFVSEDLFFWSDPIFIQPGEFVFTSDEPPFETYATLIDHASTSPSFDTIGNTPHLYFTRIVDPVNLEFDLVRVPLEIKVAGE